MSEELKELKELAGKATPGPWTKDKPGTDSTGFYAGTRIATTAPGCSVYADPPGGVFPSADRDFIAAADPQTVLSLIARIETLERWKADAIAVESRWDVQAVGRLLDVPLGGNIRPSVQPGIERLKARVETLERALEQATSTVRAMRMAELEDGCSVTAGSSLDESWEPGQRESKQE